MLERKKKLFRLGALLAYVISACSFVLAFEPVYLASIIIVLLPPSLANFLWIKNSRAKILFFSTLSTILFAPPVELVARLANVWDVQSTLPRFLGLVPLENMLFAFFNFFWVLSFYEYFSDGDKKTKIPRQAKYLIFLYCLESVVVYTLFFMFHGAMAMGYFTVAAAVLILPASLIFFKLPKLLKKTILTTVFFAVVFFIYELVSLEVGSWWWPGDYLFPVKVFGNVFPLDDVIIWYLISTPALIGGYEFFFDDKT